MIQPLISLISLKEAVWSIHSLLRVNAELHPASSKSVQSVTASVVPIFLSST
jgi:hypothetical protein